MNEKQTKTVPDHFVFKAINSDIEYEAKKFGDRYNLSWNSPSYGFSQACYDVEEVEGIVGRGSWQIILIIDDNPGDTALSNLNESVSSEEESFLSRIKVFTEVTNASVSITDGMYYVSREDGDGYPLRADTDEELEKLMNALAVIHGASKV